MGIILRNFLTTMRRFKLAFTLNVLGLAAAFAAFTLIMMQVRHDRSFDRFHPKSDRIYRLEIGSKQGDSYNALTARNWDDLIRQHLPQAEMTGLRLIHSLYGNYITPEKVGQEQWYREESQMISADFADIFDFAMIEGNRDVLREPGKIILPQSLALKYWPAEPATGKSIRFKGGFITTDTLMTVGGVYRDFSKNTLVKNVIYYGVNPNTRYKWDGWNFNYELYIILPHSVNKEDFERELTRIQHESSNIPEWYRKSAIRLTSLPDIHFTTDTEFDANPKSNPAITNVLQSVALLIILIAAINFVNFAMSLSPLRIKSINTQKVFGSSTALLRGTVLGEAAGTALVACGIGLLAVYGIGHSVWNSLFDADLAFGANRPTLYLSLGAALVVGVGAGLYPAFYYTRFPPALVLKGSFGMSSRGRALRTALLGFQYIVSIGLIIVALFMQLQNHHIRQMDKGFDTEQVAVMELNNQLTVDRHDELVNRLKASPLIEQVAFSQFLFGTGDTQIQSTNVDGTSVAYKYIPVSSDFLQTMSIRVTDGRDFREEDTELTPPRCIFNEAGRRALGNIHPGYELSGLVYQVIGFVDNINYRPLQTASDDPFCFALLGRDMQRSVGMNYTYVKIKGDPKRAADHIRRSVESMDPTLPFDIRFYDRVFDSVYQKEQKTTALITGFSLLAILISLMGVFGIVMFETQYRRKEIGVRKIFGSTSNEILRMLNTKFALIVLTCFVIAAPIAYYSAERWLSGFAYRTPMFGWVFAASLLSILLLTLLTVTLQSYHTANANPVKSMKSE